MARREVLVSIGDRENLWPARRLNVMEPEQVFNSGYLSVPMTVPTIEAPARTSIVKTVVYGSAPR